MLKCKLRTSKAEEQHQLIALEELNFPAFLKEV